MAAANVLNESDEVARIALSHCCAARAWIEGMLARRPFADDHDVLTAADEIAATLGEADWLEAFAAHPVIGDIDSLREKYAATRDSAASEQSGVATASDAVLHELAELNRAYRERFGFIFIVFASGKTAQQMLDLLKSRIENSQEQELKHAAEEQRKITRKRLQSLDADAGDR